MVIGWRLGFTLGLPLNQASVYSSHNLVHPKGDYNIVLDWGLRNAVLVEPGFRGLGFRTTVFS